MFYDVLDLCLELFLGFISLLVFLWVWILVGRDDPWASMFDQLFGIPFILLLFVVIEIFIVSDKHYFLEVKRVHHSLCGLSFHHLRNFIDLCWSIGDTFITRAKFVNLHDLAHHIEFA